MEPEPETSEMPVYDLERYVALFREDCLLGHKNASTCAMLKRPVAGHGIEDRVFVKLGEDMQSIEFTVGKFELMTQLGMVPGAMHTSIAMFKTSEAWWRDYAKLVTFNQNPLYGSGNSKLTVEQRTEKMLERLGKSMTAPMPGLIQSEFEGARLSVIDKCDPRLHRPSYAEQMLKIMVFSKLYAVTDMNAANVMMGADGSLLRVDLNPANHKQLAKFNKKGLMQSQTIAKEYIAPVRELAARDREMVASFMEQAEALCPREKGVQWLTASQVRGGADIFAAP